VSNFLIGLVSILLAASQPNDASRVVSRPAELPADLAETNDPVEKAYLKLLEDDDAAQQEADKWIRESEAFRSKGAAFSQEALTARVEQRFAPIRKAYEEFLQAHPNHVRARLAYGSFLYETLNEDQGVEQWEKARQLDPKNAAAWNNLANHYGHRGPVTKAFEYYAKAIELKPDEPVYLQNLATTVYLFRRDAMEFYHVDEKAVFDHSLELYRKALKLDPKNFPLATDYAQSYYGIKPLRTAEALTAWNDALKVANDAFEREGVYLHLARVELNSGLYEQARKHLNMVTNEFYNVLKGRLARNLAEKEKKGSPEGAPNQLGAVAGPKKEQPAPSEVK
jgi:tetratricopeptide (TPR) repeat protein